MYMKNLLILFFILGLVATACTQTNPSNNQSKDMNDHKLDIDLTKYDQATFGAGCFWCVEAVFQQLKGVAKVESGYAGGDVLNPSYREVTSGNTGHAEVCRIYYDPKVVDFNTLLDVFWTTHDPTTLNRQGADVGTQYRSAIFFHNEEQKSLAELSKREVASKLYDDPIVTEISPLKNYSVAEDYHQDYWFNNPNQGYCRIVINPKVQKFRDKFADKLKEEYAE